MYDRNGETSTGDEGQDQISVAAYPAQSALVILFNLSCGANFCLDVTIFLVQPADGDRYCRLSQDPQAHAQAHTQVNIYHTFFFLPLLSRGL